MICGGVCNKKYTISLSSFMLENLLTNLLARYGAFSQIYANNPTLYVKGEDPVVFSTRDQPNVNHVHASTWTEACKAGFDSKQHKELTSSFDYSGPFTETVIMGNLALRSRDLRNIVSIKSNGRQELDYYGRKKLLWDGENMKITNLDEANSYVSKTYRKGWELPI